MYKFFSIFKSVFQDDESRKNLSKFDNAEIAVKTSAEMRNILHSMNSSNEQVQVPKILMLEAPNCLLLEDESAMDAQNCDVYTSVEFLRKPSPPRRREIFNRYISNPSDEKKPGKEVL